MSEEKSLEPIKESERKGLQQYSDEASGETLGLEGYKPATQFGYLKIDQSSGEIEYTLTGEKRKSWKVVLTNFSFSRVMFDKDFETTTPLCKTKERKQNQLDLEGTVYGSCQSCEYAQWTDGKKPPCNLNLNWTGLIEGELVTPVGITFSGANYKFGTQLIDWFRKNKISPWQIVIEISTEGPHTRGSVEYYTYKVATRGEAGDLEFTPTELADQLAAMYMEGGGMPVFTESEESVSEGVSADRAEEILTSDDKDDKEPPF